MVVYKYSDIHRQIYVSCSPLTNMKSTNSKNEAMNSPADYGYYLESETPHPHTVHVGDGGNNAFSSESRKVALESGFFHSLKSVSWLIHALAVGATAGIVQLSFRNIYWADEDNWRSKWFLFGLKQQESMNALQFAAKLHEIFIVGSLSAIVLHFVRLRLLGHGLPFGLLTGAYPTGSVDWLFSKSFFASFTKPHDFLMGLAFAAVVVYCNMAGPSSAIAIIPNLDWWPISQPYNGEAMTSYITYPRDLVFPTSLGSGDVQCNDRSWSNDSMSRICPGGGYKDIMGWSQSYALAGIESKISIQEPISDVRRDLISTLELSSDESVAVATTLHSSVAALVGAFWNYINTHDVGEVNNATRPRFFPSEDNVFAPFVQVQCSVYSYTTARNLRRDSTYAESRGNIPQFETQGMRNFSTVMDSDKDIDWYRNTTGWELPEPYWNYTRTELNTTNFTWVDVAAWFPDAIPSLGAVLTVPEPVTVTYRNGTNVTFQDALVIPCMIDARWAGVFPILDPQTDNVVQSNISDLSVLEDYYSGIPLDDGQIPWGLTNRNIPISPGFADQLNLPVGPVIDGGSDWVNDTTAITALFQPYLTSGTLDGVDGIFRGFYPAHYNLSELARMHDEIANTVATILSFVVADGLSRVSYMSDLSLNLHDNGNGTVSTVELYQQAGISQADPVNLNTSRVDGWTPITWKVERYGWGYGFRSTTVRFGICVLLIHAGVVVLYAFYTTVFRTCGPGWSTGAWGGTGELLTLALLSRPPAAMMNTGAGIEKWDTWRQTVKIRESNDGAAQMVVAEEGSTSRLVKDRRYG